MKRRTRPLDIGERRAIQGSSIELELELLADEGDYCARWPDSPLARVLATRAESDAANAYVAAASLTLNSSAMSSLSAGLRSGSNVVKVPEVISAQSQGNDVSSSSDSASAAPPPVSELQAFLEALRPVDPTPLSPMVSSSPSAGRTKGAIASTAAAMAAVNWDVWKLEQEVMSKPRFVLPQEWAVQLSGYHAPWSRRIERLYEDLVVALEREVYQAGSLPSSVTSGAAGSFLSQAGSKARREALQGYARTVWSQLIASGTVLGGECELGEVAKLWAARRMASARPGHEFGIPLVPHFFRHAAGFDEYFLPVHSAGSDDDDSDDDDDEESSSSEENSSSDEISSSSSDQDESSSSNSSSDEQKEDIAVKFVVKRKQSGASVPKPKKAQPKGKIAPGGKVVSSKKKKPTVHVVDSDSSASLYADTPSTTTVSTQPAAASNPLSFADVASRAVSVLSFASLDTSLALLRDLHDESISSELAAHRQQQEHDSSSSSATARRRPARKKSSTIRKESAAILRLERQLNFADDGNAAASRIHDDDDDDGAENHGNFLERLLEKSSEEELRNSMLAAWSGWAVGGQETQNLFEEELFEF